MMNRIKSFMSLAECKIRQFFSKENGEVNIVAIVVLIGIAMLLAILFKDSITKLINDMFKTITDNANNAITN